MNGPTLRTARLQLRPFRSEDLASVDGYISTAEFLRYLGPGYQNAEEFMKNLEEIDWTETGSFALDLEGCVVGSVHIGSEAPNLRGELACLIAPAHWSKGLAEEACTAAIRYGFDVLGLDRIYARADVRNGGSIRTMEKLGLKREGLLREHRLDQAGSRADEVVYGMLRREWSG
jgi:ribosomal-protein-alanine N-acetyltransferase